MIETAIDADRVLCVIGDEPRWSRRSGRHYVCVEPGQPITVNDLLAPHYWSLAKLDEQARDQLWWHYSVFLDEQTSAAQWFYTVPLTEDMIVNAQAWNLQVGWSPGGLVLELGEPGNRLPVAIPEAPTMALCGMGLAGLMMRRRG